MATVNLRTARLPKQNALRFYWFNPAFRRKLPYEENEDEAPRPLATAGGRPGLAHGRGESSSRDDRQTARAL